MIGGWMPWRRLLVVWVPPVVLFLATVGYYTWQNSGTLGRGALLQAEIDELETKIQHLEQVAEDTRDDLELVAELDVELQAIYSEVFGDLDSRLTNILRTVESAARGAQMLPANFRYRVNEQKDIDCVRFEIAFAVDGQYEQIRRMLAAIRSSDQFLTVNTISFRGEAEPTRQEVAIAVRLSTYLAEADPERLRLLAASSGAVVEEGADG